MMPSCVRPHCHLICRILAACVMLAHQDGSAAEPEIRNVDIRGLATGSTTTLTIDGTNLSTETRLVLPFPAEQELKPGATATRAVFDVTVPGDVIPGIYNLRVANADGVSGTTVVGVDALPQLSLATEITALPVAVHGTVGGSAVLEARFPGRAGDEVVIDVEAQRLGGKLRPVLHLYDPNRLQVGWSWSTPRLHGDARLIAVLPVDGVYTVALHDLEYATPAPGYFRLKIGRWQYVDQVFPAVVARGQQPTLELVGTTSATAKAPPPDVTGNVIPLPWPQPVLASGLRPWVAMSGIHEVLEVPPGETPQVAGPVPLAISGCIGAAGETDRYLLHVAPGQKLHLEMTAERDGSPLDGVLILLNDQGGQLARADDGPGTSDPVLEFTVPAGVTSLVATVSDLLSRGSGESYYRLAVTSTTPGPEHASFRLLAQVDRASLLPGSRQVVPVLVERQGYDGPIELTFDNLPEGVSVDGTLIPAASEGTLLTLSVPATMPAGNSGAVTPPSEATAAGAAIIPAANAPAPEPARPAAQVTMIGLTGSAGDGQTAQRVCADAHPLTTMQPWLSSEFAVAIGSAVPGSDPASSFGVEWGEVIPDAGLVLAGKLPLSLKLTRPAGEATPVRLTLITSQIVPQLNGRPDVNRSLRPEAAVEIAADKLDGQLVALIPPDLAQDIYDLTIKAELLSANKQTVLATAYAPVRRLNVVNPVGLTVNGGPRLETTLDAKTGATVKLTGQIERRAGMAGPVTVALTGQPGGVTAANVVVKPGESAFELTVIFPANFVPAELTGLQVQASGPPDDKTPAVIVRSRPVELSIVVTKQPEAAP